MQQIPGVDRSMTGTMPERIFLSAPHLVPEDIAAVEEALRSNWVAPVGPHLAALERSLSVATGAPFALAVTNGTCALDLICDLLDIGIGDSVICQDLTFIGSIGPAIHRRAQPIFVDSEPNSFNIDPVLVRDYLDQCRREGAPLPKAIIVVDLYGWCADLDPLSSIAAEFEVPLIEDAAEALGATYKGRPAGSYGSFGVLSFNGNKIITGSSGGALLCHREEDYKRALYLATQARQPVAHYEHTDVGYNYRFSNILAALVHSQLSWLPKKIARRKAIHAAYREALAPFEFVSFLEPADREGNHWLTVILLDSSKSPVTPEDVRLYLESQNIESRRVWQPMHMQPVMADYRFVSAHQVTKRVYTEGLCLPSGSAMTDADLERVLGALQECLEQSARGSARSAA